MPDVHGDERWGRVAVTCLGRVWWLRDVPAFDWIMAATTPDMAGIFPGLIDDEDAVDMFGYWLSQPDMRERSINVSRKALERASGREWHWTQNLIGEVLKSWPYINGPLVRAGVRADSTKLPDWIDAAYTLYLEMLSKTEREALDMRLRKVPAGAAGTSRPRMSSREDLLKFAKD